MNILDYFEGVSEDQKYSSLITFHVSSQIRI